MTLLQTPVPTSAHNLLRSEPGILFPSGHRHDLKTRPHCSEQGALLKVLFKVKEKDDSFRPILDLRGLTWVLKVLLFCMLTFSDVVYRVEWLGPMRGDLCPYGVIWTAWQLFTNWTSYSSVTVQSHDAPVYVNIERRKSSLQPANRFLLTLWHRFIQKLNTIQKCHWPSRDLVSSLQ